MRIAAAPETAVLAPFHEMQGLFTIPWGAYFDRRVRLRSGDRRSAADRGPAASAGVARARRATGAADPGRRALAPAARGTAAHQPTGRARSRRRQLRAQRGDIAARAARRQAAAAGVAAAAGSGGARGDRRRAGAPAGAAAVAPPVLVPARAVVMDGVARGRAGRDAPPATARRSARSRALRVARRRPGLHRLLADRRRRAAVAGSSGADRPG